MSRRQRWNPVRGTANRIYERRERLLALFDPGTFHEIGEQYAPNLITGFSRVDGRTVGVVASQKRMNTASQPKMSAKTMISNAVRPKYCVTNRT